LPIRLKAPEFNHVLVIGLPFGAVDNATIAMSPEIGWTVEQDQVDSYKIEGSHAEGTVTFTSAAGDGPVSGTFEVTCADD